MGTEKLFGQSMLMDGASRVVLRGEIALLSDGVGRSEIHVRNDETGLEEKLIFSTGPMWIPVMHLIQVIREIHEGYSIDVVDDDGGVCPECIHGEYEDDEGNWRPCPRCQGVR